MVDLQKTLIKTAIEEYDVQLQPQLNKRDVLSKIILIESIITQIFKWKNDHPEAIQELVKLEQSLLNYIKPGEDGTFQSSELVLKLKELSAAGISKYWLYPVVFGAGSISMVVIFGMFEWIISQNDL